MIGAVHDLIGPSDALSEKHTDLAFQVRPSRTPETRKPELIFPNAVIAEIRPQRRRRHHHGGIHVFLL